MRQCFTRTCIDVADAQRFARVAGLCPGARRESAVHALAERYVDDESVLDASWLSRVIFATRAGGLSRLSREAPQAPVHPDA
jgi:hypothetical protein